MRGKLITDLNLNPSQRSSLTMSGAYDTLSRVHTSDNIRLPPWQIGYGHMETLEHVPEYFLWERCNDADGRFYVTRLPTQSAAEAVDRLHKGTDRSTPIGWSKYDSCKSTTPACHPSTAINSLTYSKVHVPFLLQLFYPHRQRNAMEADVIAAIDNILSHDEEIQLALGAKEDLNLNWNGLVNQIRVQLLCLIWPRNV